MLWIPIVKAILTISHHWCRDIKKKFEWKMFPLKNTQVVRSKLDRSLFHEKNQLIKYFLQFIYSHCVISCILTVACQRTQMQQKQHETRTAKELLPLTTKREVTPKPSMTWWPIWVVDWFLVYLLTKLCLQTQQRGCYSCIGNMQHCWHSWGKERFGLWWSSGVRFGPPLIW